MKKTFKYFENDEYLKFAKNGYGISAESSSKFGGKFYQNKDAGDWQMKPDYDPLYDYQYEIYGTAKDDVLEGTVFNDMFFGSFGADHMDGKTGSDTVSYQAGTRGVYVDLYEGFGRGGLAEGDTYESIENIIGTNHNDLLRGSTADNTISAGAGSDVIIATSGNDVIDGGAGKDTLSYLNAPDGYYITVNLALGIVNDTRNIHQVNSIERVIGSNGNDVFYGDENDNTFEGLSGNDVFFADVGRDSYDGGAGVDTLVVNDNHVFVNLMEGGSSIGGTVGSDTYRSIENLEIIGTGNTVIGSTINNEISSTGKANTIQAGDGNDAVELANFQNTNVDLGDGDDSLTLIAQSRWEGLYFELASGSADGGNGRDVLDLSGLNHGVMIKNNTSNNGTEDFSSTIERSEQHSGEIGPVFAFTNFEEIITTSQDDIVWNDIYADNKYVSGAGSDLFVISDAGTPAGNFDHDVITDFDSDIGGDRLYFGGSPELADFLNGGHYTISESAEGTTLAYGWNSLLLENVAISDLSEFNFV